MKLTFYLFHESITEFESAIKSEKFEGDDAFEVYEPNQTLPFEAIAYFQKNRTTQPKWLDFLTDYFDVDPNEFSNTTNSFLLLIKVRDRIFAVTAGFGFSAINRNKIERGFGLRVSLNAIDPTRIKGIDVRKIDTTTRQKRVLLNRDSPLYDFEFDVNEDLLSLVSGQPYDNDLARKLVGSDSLSLTADLDFLTLGEKCEVLLDTFLKEDYKEGFDFIDNLVIVKEQDIKIYLDASLIDALEGHHSDKLVLTFPEIDNLNQVEQFKFMYQRKSSRYEDVHLDWTFDNGETTQLSLSEKKNLYK